MERYKHICNIYEKVIDPSKIPEGAKKIIRILNEFNYGAFLVGGCVRDLLLGKKPHDYDISTDAPPSTVMEIFTSLGFKVIPTGIEFGTVTIVMEDGAYEVTTYRLEFYTEERGRKPVTAWANSLYDDVIRRDFTINAMALDVEGNVIDCVGGLQDLYDKTIRFVRNPVERIREDPLRMLRAIRFAAKYEFKIEENSYNAIRENYWRLKYISWERIRDEILKAADTKGFHIFVALLYDSKLYLIVMSEMEDMASTYHTYTKHHRGESVLEHTIEGIMRLDEIEAKPLLKVAYLLHDVGKPRVATPEGRFIGHEIVGKELAEEICRRWRMSNREISYITYIVRWHMHPLAFEDRDPETIAKKIVSKHRELAPDLLLISYADTGNSKYIEAYNIALEIIAKASVKPVVTGHDIIKDLGIPPGPRVGELKQKLFEIQVMYNLKTKEEIYRKARELGII